MTAHLFPWMACAARIARSSSSVNGPRLTIGLSWLHHLRREGGGGGARGLSDEVERGQSVGIEKLFESCELMAARWILFRMSEVPLVLSPCCCLAPSAGPLSQPAGPRWGGVLN